MERNAGIAAAVSSSKKKKTDDPLRWFLGMLVVSCFSMVYFVAPSYMISAILALAFRYPTFYIACIYASPMLLSAVVPSFPAPFLYRYLKPMLDYFDYEEIIETKPIDVADKILSGTNYLCVCQPHGALSITGIASAINASRPEFAGKLATAVADAVLYTPIIKHVMGIFGLISASKASMKKTLKKKGLAGTIVLYVGGMAELFLTSETEERLYLKKRKGFIKLALTEGVDIVPIYLFGNTSVLSVLKNGMLASLSRKTQVSLTYIWGKYYLPIPRDLKLLYVSGQPLGMPHITAPSQKEIDFWHAKYCSEVERIFNQVRVGQPYDVTHSLCNSTRSASLNTNTKP